MITSLSASDMGTKVKIYRTALGLTQLQLADAAGVKQAEISRLEKGKSPKIPARKLSRIAQALGVSTSHLLDEVPLLAEWPPAEYGEC